METEAEWLEGGSEKDFLEGVTELPDEWNATPPEDHSWPVFNGMRYDYNVGVYLNHHRIGDARFSTLDDAMKFHALMNGETP